MAALNRIKVICAYDGFDYQGWQKQENANSIQAVIEQMLSNMHQRDIIITASGRTDAQVHACGQVFHFDSDKQLDSYHWKAAMNSMLPQNIRILSTELVDDTFHARFSAIAKRYDYYITDQIDNPFYQRYTAFERTALDVAYMQECADIFIGTHDFTSFTSAKIDPRKPRTKTVYQLRIDQQGDRVRMCFIGNGFLRYMVRMLAQVLIEAGKHQLTKQQLQIMLESKSKHACRYKAQAQGLYLTEVYYNESELSHAYRALSSCDRQ